MTAAVSEKDEVYLFERNDAELRRLNEQHNLLTRLCRNSLLELQIPANDVRKIADVGTGTGIWLKDLARRLSNPPSLEREYFGFDISAKHFPSTPGKRMSFHQHDILEPFPVAFHGKFDLVHIRLLVLALKKTQFQTAVTNVIQLLKPGGYIQWEEFETKNMTFIPPSDITSQVRGIMRTAAQAYGLSNTPCADISGYLEELGFTKVEVVDYDSSSREDLVLDAREWTKDGARAGLYYALLRDASGRSLEETKMLADELLAQYVEKIDKDVVPTMPLARVIGQKPF